MRSRRTILVATFLAGACGALLHAQKRPTFGRATEAPALVPRVRRLHPVRGLRELADWFQRNGRPGRAWEIVAFALAHAPSDPDLLRRAAVLNRDIGDRAAARVFARKALAQRPGDSFLVALLRELTPSAPGTGSTTGPASGGSGEAGAEEAGEEPAPLSLARKLHVLGLMRMLRSAITAYDQTHRKEPLEELDLDKLREAGLLPKDFEDPDLEALSYADGALTHDPAGTLDALKEAVGRFQEGLADAEEWMGKGQPHEALAVLKELEESFGDAPEILALRSRALGEIDPEQAWLEAADRSESDAVHALEKALTLWRTGDTRGARETLGRLRRTWPDSPHAEVAGRLEELAARELPLDFLYSFYEKRARAVAPTTVTTGETPPESEE
jgi:tetratricopeptide (TPR) repeat protein